MRFRLFLLSLSGLACLATLPVHADCVAPLNDVRIPNGNKATMEEMVAASHTLQENTTEVESFFHCLKSEQAAKIDAIGPAITDEQRTKIASEYANRLTAEQEKLQRLADRFDLEERNFRTRQATLTANDEDAEETAAVNEAERDATEQAHKDAAAEKADAKETGQGVNTAKPRIKTKPIVPPKTTEPTPTPQ
jgi:hypothetical protein